MPMILIPARYGSTRLNGKPLIKIAGKEMILHVAEKCVKKFGESNVYVVTDDRRIADCVTSNGIRASIVYGDGIETGSDRCAVFADMVDDDVIVNVQGDEPLLDVNDVVDIIALKRIYHDHIINCYSVESKNIENVNTIKMIMNEKSELVYASRLPVPYKAETYNRQVCLCAFYKEQLIRYYGRFKKKSYLESLENIELLRCFDGEQKIFMHLVHGKYQSVDVIEDIVEVEKWLLK